jgi:hypothetical protein
MTLCVRWPREASENYAGLTLSACRNVTPTDSSLQKRVAFAAGNDGSIPGTGNQTFLLYSSNFSVPLAGILYR